MGRKSKPRSKNTSKHSIVIFHKSKENRKKKNKTKKNIRKLFDKLRNESSSTLFSSENNTVIEVQETPKAKLNTKNKSNNLIVIDDDLVTNNEPCPLQCSTPRSQHFLDISLPENNLNNNTNCTQNFNEEVENLTKEINRDSYLTIDLTTESLNATNPNVTVIDLENTSDVNDCSISDISMSGDSDVTVINTKRKTNLDLKRFAKGIENLNSSARGELLKLIAKKILNDCDRPGSSKNSLPSLMNGVSRAPELADTYIKEVILRQPSRNSVGSNIYNPERDINNKTGLRMIVIDGSNVAMQHSKGRVFSVKGLKICIDYFLQRGHCVKAFVPQFRCKAGKSTDGKLLDQLERQGLVVYTPSREIQGRMITSYDDRYIVQCAAEFDGVIVSRDNYRDLLGESERWRNVIENRLLQFTWVGDMIMFPRDPLGRHGPTLEEFLKHPCLIIED